MELRESAQAVEAMTTVAVKLRPICGRTPSRVAASSYPGAALVAAPFHCISACPAFSEVGAANDDVSAPFAALSARTRARFMTAARRA